MTGIQPRISAVITAYNCSTFIRDAIESVLAQTRPVDEIVVVDDGSTDDTATVVAAYADRLRYVYQPNQGAGAARNRGICETSGDLIAFLDGDDIWLPNKTVIQAEYLATHPEVALVGSDRWQWNVRLDKRRIERFGDAVCRNVRREIAVRNVVGNPSQILLRRSVLDEVGVFDPALRWGQDWDLWIRIVAHARVGFIHEPLIIYRWHLDGLTHSRGWERHNVVFNIARRAIREYQPLWWRPLLLARAWSAVEFNRCVYLHRRQRPRLQYAWHAARALAAYPFEQTTAKAGMVARSLIGEPLYRRIRAHPSVAALRRQRSPRQGVTT